MLEHDPTAALALATADATTLALALTRSGRKVTNSMNFRSPPEMAGVAMMLAHRTLLCGAIAANAERCAEPRHREEVMRQSWLALRKEIDAVLEVMIMKVTENAAAELARAAQEQPS